MENIGNEISGAGNAPHPALVSNSEKSGNSTVTYVLAALLIAIVGGLFIGVGLPFISLASAASVNTNAVLIPSQTDGTTSGVEFQEINMTVDNGWVPSSFVIKTGVPVRWNVYVKSFGGCINGLQALDLGIRYQFQQTGITKTFEFTPKKAGTIYFSCLMNMATGRIEVRDDVTVSGAATTNAAAANNPAQKASGCGCGGGCGGGCAAKTTGSGSCGMQ